MPADPLRLTTVRAVQDILPRGLFVSDDGRTAKISYHGILLAIGPTPVKAHQELERIAGRVHASEDADEVARRVLGQ